METKSKNNLFFRLYNNVQTRIYSFLLIIVHNHSDAEDILQETASIMWEKFDQYEQGTNFEAWAMSIAKRKALEFLRKNKRSRMIFQEQYYDLISNQALQTTEDVSDRVQAVNHCLQKLSEKDRNLLSMRFKKNIPLKHISNITGRSASGICQSFSRILDVLRACVTAVLAQQDS